MCCGVDNPDNWLESTFYLQNRRFPDSCSSGCNSSNSNCITLEGINVHSMVRRLVNILKFGLLLQYLGMQWDFF